MRGGSLSSRSASRGYLGTTNKAPAVLEWFDGGTGLVMPVVRQIWLDIMPQLLAKWSGAQSIAETIRVDEVVDTGMVRATCGPCSRGSSIWRLSQPSDALLGGPGWDPVEIEEHYRMQFRLGLCLRAEGGTEFCVRLRSVRP